MTPGTWRPFRAQRDPAMRAIDRKLVRDLSRLQGQVITIGLVIACGVAAYVALRGTHRSLLHARDAYYERVSCVVGNAPRAKLTRDRRSS